MVQYRLDWLTRKYPLLSVISLPKTQWQTRGCLTETITITVSLWSITIFSIQYPMLSGRSFLVHRYPTHCTVIMKNLTVISNHHHTNLSTPCQLGEIDKVEILLFSRKVSSNKTKETSSQVQIAECQSSYSGPSIMIEYFHQNQFIEDKCHQSPCHSLLNLFHISVCSRNLFQVLCLGTVDTCGGGGVTWGQQGSTNIQDQVLLQVNTPSVQYLTSNREQSQTS